MKYKMSVGGETIEVPYLEFGIDSDNASEGSADLYIFIRDWELHVYTDERKKHFWIKWLDAHCMVKNNPEDIVKKVVAEVYGGVDDNQLLRKITIEKAYISRFREFSTTMIHGGQVNFEVEIRKDPHVHCDYGVSTL